MSKFILYGLFLCVFCFSQQTLFGQTDTLRQSYFHDYEARKYAIGYAKAQKLLALTPSKTVEYASVLHDLGMISRAIGNDSAEFYFKQALDSKAIQKGKANNNYINTLQELALFYEAQKREKEAITLWNEIQNWSQNPKVNLWHVYFAAQSMGEFLYGKRELDKALVAFKRLITVNDSIQKIGLALPTKNLDELSTQRNIDTINERRMIKFYHLISATYASLNHFEEAKAYAEKALISFRKYPSLKLAPAVLNLVGSIHLKLGETRKALIFYQEALDSAIVAKESPQRIATITNNIGLLYDHKLQFKEALPYYEKLVVFLKKEKTIRPLNYANALYKLGYVQLMLQQTTPCFANFTEAAAIKDTLESAKQYADYAHDLKYWGYYYHQTGELDKALYYFQKAYTHTRQFNPTKYLNINDAALMLGLVAYEKGISATKWIDTFTVYRHKDTQQNFAFLSEEGREAYLQSVDFQFSRAQSLHLLTNVQTSNRALFENLLQYKGILLQKNLDVQKTVTTRNEPETRALTNDLRKVSLALETHYNTPLPMRRTNADSLTELYNRLEANLVKKIGVFEGNVFHFDSIRKNLNNDEACIEFVHFRYFRRGIPTDSIIYGAYIIRADLKQPYWVTLFEEQELAKYWKNNISISGEQLVNSFYKKSRGIKPANQTNQMNQSVDLHKLVWASLDKHLVGVKKVWYSPTGLLHRLSFSALPLSNDSFLGDKYVLENIGSSRHIKKQKVSTVFSDAIVLGGVNYDAEKSTDYYAATSYALKRSLSMRQTNLRQPLTRSGGIVWTPLQGTYLELNTVAALLRGQKIAVTSLSGNAASEENLKACGGGYLPSPTLLHIATHGYFFTAEDSIKTNQSLFETSEQPLMRSGLILAGANHFWQKKQQLTGQEDGILTAYEISHLNLKHTKLAVLSACETGLGDIRGNEGVYGLQRAFKMAGVEYLLVSLWKIPDAPTAELMSYFYKQLATAEDINTAFNTAQKAMRKKYKNDPFYWAGFVLTH